MIESEAKCECEIHKERLVGKYYIYPNGQARSVKDVVSEQEDDDNKDSWDVWVIFDNSDAPNSTIKDRLKEFFKKARLFEGN